MALLAPDPRAIAPSDPTPSEDRAPDWVAGGTPQPMRGELERLLGAEVVLSRATDLVRYASDASPYRKIPKVVVMARNSDDVAKVLEYARQSGHSVTFRAGGTSLNGQGQSDSILVDVRRHWRGVEVLDDGARARVKPGTILGHANRVLAPHAHKLGPDPASTDIATVGGVVANNSGGMRCGVTKDSYSTVESLTFMTAAGTTIDTAAADAAERFATAEPELAAGLAAIRDEIRADDELSARIRRKFEIKNTTGYRLCAFLDADEPVEIFRRLLIGSEGTLGLVCEATFETVAVPKKTSTAWLHFPDIPSACEPVPGLVAAGATAVEMMVAPALMVAAMNIPGTPQDWLQLPPESAALLVEYGADTEEELVEHEKAAIEAVGEGLIRDPAFTHDDEVTEVNWRVREGLHGLVGRLRIPGTALIIEDVCVPPARIAECATDLQKLLGEHNFLTGVAGHTSAGNLHFMLTPDFSKQSDLDNYDHFMDGLVDLVLGKFDGSLKAEHGTGINMAPYVEREWGEQATALMWRVKELADPGALLGPGVVLNRDSGAHLQDLKTTPEIEEVANHCVECGFCEPACPSRDLTTTPRQRIVLRREMARQPAGSPVLNTLLDEFEYDGLETCAADGTCVLACPLGIDTGKLIKGLRAEQHSERAETVAKRTAQRWATVERAARGGLRAGDAVQRALGAGPVGAASRAARSALGRELVPEWPENMPRPARATLPPTTREGATAVYLPACINRIFGSPRGTGGANGSGPEPSLPEALVALSARAGKPVWIPDDVAGNCCATPWHSKGYREGHALMAKRTLDSLWRWSDGGRLPVVCDATSCTLGLVEEMKSSLDEADAERHGKLQILDATGWAAEHLLSGLQIKGKLASAVVHPTCSTRHLGLGEAQAALAEAMADEVTVPLRATCCGFAGDRGFLHPELTASATAEEAVEVRDGGPFDAHLCGNRTCEVGLEQGTGQSYESPILTLERLTR